LHYNKLKADNEISASGKLRMDMYSLREKTRNELQAKHAATDYALRRRIYETQRQKNKLQWQRQKV
jgi:tektin-2